MLGAGAGARLVQVFSGKEHQLVTRCTWAGSEPFPGLAWPIRGRRLRRRGGAASGLSLCSWSLSRHHTCAVSTAWPPCAHLLWPHPESRGGLWPERCAQGSPSARCFLALSLTLLSPGVVSVPGLCAAVSFSQGGLRAGVRSLLRSPPPQVTSLPSLGVSQQGGDRQGGPGGGNSSRDRGLLGWKIFEVTDEGTESQGVYRPCTSSLGYRPRSPGRGASSSPARARCLPGKTWLSRNSSNGLFTAGVQGGDVTCLGGGAAVSAGCPRNLFRGGVMSAKALEGPRHRRQCQGRCPPTFAPGPRLGAPRLGSFNDLACRGSCCYHPLSRVWKRRAREHEGLPRSPGLLVADAD